MKVRLCNGFVMPYVMVFIVVIFLLGGSLFSAVRVFNYSSIKSAVKFEVVTILQEVVEQLKWNYINGKVLAESHTNYQRNGRVYQVSTHCSSTGSEFVSVWTITIVGGDVIEKMVIWLPQKKYD